jgi:hypothetical protein
MKNINAILSVTLHNKISTFYSRYCENYLELLKYFSMIIVSPEQKTYIIGTNLNYIIEYVSLNLAKKSLILTPETIANKRVVSWKYGLKNGNQQQILNYLIENKHSLHNGTAFIRPLGQGFTAIYSMASDNTDLLTLIETFKHFDEIHALGDFMLDVFYEDITAYLGFKIPKPNIPYKAPQAILDNDLNDIIKTIRDYS